MRCCIVILLLMAVHLFHWIVYICTSILGLPTCQLFIGLMYFWWYFIYCDIENKHVKLNCNLSHISQHLLFKNDDQSFKQIHVYILFIHSLRRKKSSLFPLTLPKKLGTVGRHNFFFLINFFFKESYSFLYCKHVHFCYFYLNCLKKQVKHHYLDKLSTILQ